MENNRRSFLKKSAITGIGLGTYPYLVTAAESTSTGTQPEGGTQEAFPNRKGQLSISFWI